MSHAEYIFLNAELTAALDDLPIAGIVASAPSRPKRLCSIFQLQEMLESSAPSALQNEALTSGRELVCI